jgi:blue light- and temperature-responsive anti-repressor
MSNLIQLIYSSSATKELQDSELLSILEASRRNNAARGVTGMLLSEKWSFFQILEGPAEAVEAVYKIISTDPRHTRVITIVKEAIPQRSFGEWTMGSASLNTHDIQDVTGMNDFFSEASILTQINSGRAKKLVNAFKDGRWRSKVNNQNQDNKNKQVPIVQNKTNQAEPQIIDYQFHPIMDVSSNQSIAHEIIICKNGLQINDELSSYTINDLANHYTLAIDKIKKSEFNSSIFINLMADDTNNARTAIQAIIDAAGSHGMNPNQIIVEIDHEKLIGDVAHFAAMIEEFRGLGLSISIAHFGAGKAGLTLLETMQPNFISLNKNLVSDVHANGQRQAIVRGVIQTCNDLGIDLIVRHASNPNDYDWLKDEGISLFQASAKS